MPQLTSPTAIAGAYADINGLRTYYERHGDGPPVVLLHGAFSNIETDFGGLIPLLAQHRQVIAIERQGHGRTGDIDRPLSYEQWADDTAALLQHLGIDRADVFGYSQGGGVALQLASRHPALVRKLVLTGGTASRPDGMHPELVSGVLEADPEPMIQMLTGTPWHQAYLRLAPDPAAFPELVRKKVDLDRRWTGWPDQLIHSLAAPALIVVGDADIVRLEHVVELFRLFGGGVAGDLTGLPASQLAVLPGTTHVSLVDKTAWLASMTEAFLAAPEP